MAHTLNSAQTALSYIKSRMEKARRRFGTPPEKTTLVAVSKTFSADEVRPFLEAGQRVFGENRVQEAKEKWPELRVQFADVQLHLIGPLQSNKAREAVALFDVIESVDREKIAVALAEEMTRSNKALPCFVQVNIGGEAQKAGVAIGETLAFVERCKTVHGLNIIGLMCIPPDGQPAGSYFAHLAQLAADAKLSHISMGMSGDFETAIAMGATHVRVGSALFGKRATL